MAKQINPALARLWLPGSIRQYGYESPIRVGVNSESSHRVLDYLELGVSAAQLAELPAISGSSVAEVSLLLERLGGAVKQNSGHRQPLQPGVVNELFAELARIYLESASDPAAVLERRAGANIFIENFDRTGMTIARGLAASFIGKLLSLDRTNVTTADTLELGHEPSFLGLSRVKSASRQISGIRIEHHSRVSGSMDQVDMAILSATDATNPESYRIWMSRDIPHLAIVFDEAGVKVSPLILPGVTPCLACYEISRIRQNPDWVSIGPQLLGLDRSLADSAMLLFASSIVINQALNLIDHGIETITQPGVSLTRSGELASREAIEANCGCR